MLNSVTSPGSSPDVRTYLYEDAANGSRLTGVTFNGVRYSTYSYDTSGRAAVSGLAGGEERETFTYGTNATTVTNATGQSVTYNYVLAQGALKLASTTSNATPTCPYAVASRVYDANGWLDYTLDWNGNKTDYTYDAAGKLLDLTTASGTPRALIQVNTWSGDDLITTTFKTAAGAAYAQVGYGYIASGLATGKLASVTATDLRVGGTRQTTYGYAYHSNGVMSSMSSTQALPGGASNVTSTNFDATGNVSSISNGVGHSQYWTNYNALGQAGRFTDANGVISDFSYDAKGNLLAQTTYLPNGTRSTSYAYNNNRQVTDVYYASGRVTRTRYTASMRVAQQGNAQGEFVSHDFDVPSNTWRSHSTRNVPSWNGSAATASVAGQFAMTTQMDSQGRPRVQVGNNGQQLTLTYDGMGNVKSRSDVIGRITSFDYDEQNRLIRTTAPDGGIVSQSYDAEGNLGSVTDPRGLVTSYAYNGLGQV
jgi:YD repeat-containing protein